MSKILPTLVLTGALLPCATAAQVPPNRLVNPGFDATLAGWQIVAAFNPTHGPADADGSTMSGSATVSAPAGTALSVRSLYQCLPFSGGNSATLAFKVEVAQHPDLSRALGAVYYYDQPACAGSVLGEKPVVPPGDLHLGVWQNLYTLTTAPAGTQSAEVRLIASTTASGGAQTISWDDVYFGSQPDPGCFSSSKVLCLDDSPADQRFEVISHFATTSGSGASGSGQAISLSALGVGQGGIFWFFDHNNPELLVKDHNACLSTDYFWIFVSAATNVNVDLAVGDVTTGAVVLFHNPDQSSFPTIHDFLALPCD
ncbi:MAG TPA: hypothetical protein VKA53_06815 [Thermoanaerobaculia bacterium]|nr:hypothetical protein [Thermoanaerobaculia bacterium]